MGLGQSDSRTPEQQDRIGELLDEYPELYVQPTGSDGTLEVREGGKHVGFVLVDGRFV